MNFNRKPTCLILTIHVFSINIVKLFKLTYTKMSKIIYTKVQLKNIQAWAYYVYHPVCRSE